MQNMFFLFVVQEISDTKAVPVSDEDLFIWSSLEFGHKNRSKCGGRPFYLALDPRNSSSIADPGYAPGCANDFSIIRDVHCARTCRIGNGQGIQTKLQKFIQNLTDFQFLCFGAFAGYQSERNTITRWQFGSFLFMGQLENIKRSRSTSKLTG